MSSSSAGSGRSKKSLYFDVAYVPASADAEFFRRVQASHYILTCAEPSRKLLESIVDGRRAYLVENRLTEPTQPAVIVPTYESTTLAAWQHYSAADLQSLRLEVALAASQCLIKLQGAPSSTAATGTDASARPTDSDNQYRAFRLEF